MTDATFKTPAWFSAPAHDSHNFSFSEDDGARCIFCDCRWGGRWSPLPCGLDEGDIAAVLDDEGNHVDRETAFDILAQRQMAGAA